MRSELPHTDCVWWHSFFFGLRVESKSARGKKSLRLFLNVKPCHGIPIECIVHGVVSATREHIDRNVRESIIIMTVWLTLFHKFSLYFNFGSTKHSGFVTGFFYFSSKRLSIVAVKCYCNSLKTMRFLKHKTFSIASGR